MLDPNIALSGKPPQIENALDVQSKALQLQAQQQQAAGGSLQLQQQMLDLQDQKTYRDAWREAGGNPEQAQALAVQRGVGPKTAIAVQQQLTQMAESRAKLKGSQFDNLTKANDLQRDALEPILNETDPIRQAALWDRQMAGLVQQGVLSQQEVAQHPYPGPQGVKDYAAAHETDKWVQAHAAMMRGQAAAKGEDLRERQYNEAAPKREADLQESRLKASTAALAATSQQLSAAPTPEAYDQIRDSSGLAAQFPSSRSVFDANGQFLPGQQKAIQRIGMTSEQRTQADQADANAAALAKDRATPKTEAELARDAADPTKPPEVRGAASAALKRLDQSRREGRPVTNVQLAVPGLGPGQAGQTSQATGETYLAALPAATAAQVRAIAEGRAALPGIGARGQGLALRNAVFAYDPNFSEQRAQVRRAFTTGKDGQNIGSLNTATVHLDQLGEAAKAMANGTLVPGNQLYNYIATTFGVNATTNFQALQAAVAGEMANALKGNATDPEIATMMKTTNSAQSPQQLAGAVETHLHTLGAKLNTYRERYQQAIPGDTTYSPVLPSARAVYQKHDIDPTAGPAANVSGGGTLPKGGGKAADAVVIQQYLKANGGDKDKTRKALGDAGWVIPKAQ